ncbi:MAG: hypothetical protein M3R45_10690 [Pseudomonadota bacterium]|nr:hypothetical protein [Pseudomonadota bacterium]
MTPLPLAVTSVGMVTGVGLNAPASCAAIRCAIDHFTDTRYRDSGGEWIMGSEVALDEPWRGRTKLLKMAACAIQECLSQQALDPATTPLLLCLSEQERQGRVIGDEHQFLGALQDEVGMRFHHESCVIGRGHIAVAIALKNAQRLFQTFRFEQILIVATDSLLLGPTLADFEAHDRLLTSRNFDGFIPGEAGVALAVAPVHAREHGQLICAGLGFGVETAPIHSDQPLRADGLTAAIRDALNDAGCAMHDMDFRITDLSGDQYYFKEASLALLRLLRARKEAFDIWHPADCVGEVGAAIGPVMIAVLKAACEKGYAKGRHILAHLGNDDGKRSGMVFFWRLPGEK